MFSAKESMISKLIAIWSLGAALLVSGCAERVVSGPMNGYLCKIERSDPRGALQLYAELDPAGGVEGWSGFWRHRSGPMELEAIWVAEHPAADIADTSQINVNLARAPGIGRRISNVTLRFRRASEAIPALTAWVTMYDTSYYGRGIRAGDLRAAARGGPLDVTAIDRKGTVLGQGTFDAAVLDAGHAMVAEARAEIDGMRADYRNRCTVTHAQAPNAAPLVIT
jgi:hypothetical protein